MIDRFMWIYVISYEETLLWYWSNQIPFRLLIHWCVNFDFSSLYTLICHKIQHINDILHLSSVVNLQTHLIQFDLDVKLESTINSIFHSTKNNFQRRSCERGNHSESRMDSWIMHLTIYLLGCTRLVLIFHHHITSDGSFPLHSNVSRFSLLYFFSISSSIYTSFEFQ